ncbi:Pesticin receptor precursor [Tsuneonella dongtanensis]|uniref:Pesticin receptor n=1 Tax=Tsuneonella dongtanensis TaxID=692370 RepID=A0A1B2AG69_9SPHN|nr:TonB-dependent receptor [Tsuneonella dongtanensis]ANY21139.1 Pesticin receptor precursor [Tsuneonella dongtanensis]
MAKSLSRYASVSFTALACGLAATPGMAQQVPDDAAAEEPVIVVTAQKREQSLQDVPIAVTAFSSDTLDNKTIDDAVDLSFSVPNLTVTDVGASLRGIGNLAISSTSESGLGYHVNGVYIGDPALGQEYFDLERIEVLRGPQGTLYGRNTTAGVLNLITKKPTREFEGYVTATYGNYDSKRIEGALNVPLGGALAARVAGFFLDRDGYTTNLFTGNDVDDRHMYGVRGTLGLDLGATRANLVVGYFKQDDASNFGTKGVCKKDAAIGCSPLERGFETPDSRITIFDLLGRVTGTLPSPSVDYFAGAVNPTDLRTINQDIDPARDIEEWNVSFEVSHDFGNITLTSLTGYQRNKYDIRNDFDRFVPTGQLLRPITFEPLADGVKVTTTQIISGRRDFGDSEQWSQELRLASDFDGPVNFLIGGNYFDLESSRFVNITHPTLAARQQAAGIPVVFEAYRIDTNPATTRSFGLFGEVYFDLTERTHLTGGIRYSNDKKTILTREQFLNPVNGGERPFISGEFKKGVVTGRIVLDHEFTDNLNGYVSVARGYKAGGINPGGAVVPTFAPEFLNAGEVGLKFQAFDGSFLLNSSAFYYDYKGLQIGQVGVTSANTVNTDAKVYGAEFEWVARPSRRFQFDGSFSLLKTQIKGFQSGDEGDPNAIAPGAVIVLGPNGQPLRNGSGVIIKNLDGNDLPFSPAWKISLGVQYAMPLGGDLELVPRLDHYQQSQYYGTAFAKPIDQFNGYSQTDFKLLLAPVDRQWSLRGYAKNLFNRDDVIRMSQEGPLVGRFRSLHILEPRTYGIEGTFRF